MCSTADRLQVTTHHPTANRSRQPLPNVSSALRCWNNYVREASDLKNFISKLCGLKVGLEVCHCNVCGSLICLSCK